MTIQPSDKCPIPIMGWVCQMPGANDEPVVGLKPGPGLVS